MSSFLVWVAFVVESSKTSQHVFALEMLRACCPWPEEKLGLTARAVEACVAHGTCAASPSFNKDFSFDPFLRPLLSHVMPFTLVLLSALRSRCVEYWWTCEASLRSMQEDSTKQAASMFGVAHVHVDIVKGARAADPALASEWTIEKRP